MSQTILFFGNERLATGVSTSAPVFQGLIDAGYEIAALVVAQNDTGPSRKGRGLEIAEVAARHNIPLLVPAQLSDARDELAAYQAEAAVLVAFGKIVPAEVINLFPKGIINLHPSLLPKHRGPTPLESVILNGAAETGVSLMRLAPKMDAGPVYAQRAVALTGTETKQELATTLNQLGANMLVEHLPAILNNELEPQPQDDSQASYDQKVNKKDSLLDWNKSAKQLEREIRAYQGWPRSRTTIGTIEMVITKAHIGAGAGTPGSIWLENNQLGMRTSDGILIIDSLIPSGKKEMPASAFLAGYPIA